MLRVYINHNGWIDFVDVSSLRFDYYYYYGNIFSDVSHGSLQSAYTLYHYIGLSLCANRRGAHGGNQR
jgi:hypothetical protein